MVVGDLHSDGAGRGPKERKVGQRASLIGSLTFDDVSLPGDALLGEKPRGFHIMMSVFVKGRVGIGALLVGIAQADLEASVAFAGKRKQFGKEIARFRGMQWILADMAKGFAASRLPVLDVAGKLERGEYATMSCSMAECFAAGAAIARTEDSVQVFGGSGYIRGFKVERLHRDAKICQIYQGTYRIQQMILARELIKNGSGCDVRGRTRDGLNARRSLGDNKIAQRKTRNFAPQIKSSESEICDPAKIRTKIPND